MAAQARRLGLLPHVLRVDWGAAGPPRRQDKMESARRARYGLLLESCAQQRLTHLLVAHHAGGLVVGGRGQSSCPKVKGRQAGRQSSGTPPPPTTPQTTRPRRF